MIQCPSNRCRKPTGPFSSRGTLPVGGQWFELFWCDSDKLFFLAREGEAEAAEIYERFRGFPEQNLNWVGAGPGTTRWGLGSYIIELTHSYRDVEVTIFWMDNRMQKQRISLEWSSYNATPAQLLPLFQSKPDLKGAAEPLSNALAFLLKRPAGANPNLQQRRV